MLIVAPRVHTNRATRRGTPRLCSATLSEVGRVAALEEVLGELPHDVIAVVARLQRAHGRVPAA